MKPTSLPWCTALPAHWEVVPLRYVATIGTGHTPDRNNVEYWEHCTLPWVTAADVSARADSLEPLLETEQHVSELGLEHSAAVVHPTDTVMLCRTASIGLSVRIGRPMATTQAFVTWTCGPRLSPRYLHLVVRAMAPEWDRLAYGSTHRTIYMPDLDSLRVPLPPLSEQEAIVDRVHGEVARIDALIHSERRRLSVAHERLVSATQALVLGQTHSSIGENEPLGPLHPMPTHWEMRRNKTFMHEVVDLSTSGEEELLTVSHITGVTPRSEKEVTMFLAESNAGYKRVRPGDLVVNTMWAWMGALGVSDYHGIVSPAYGVYRFTGDGVSNPYFHALFRSPAYVAEMTRYSKGVWTSRLRLYPESFLTIRSPFPPMHEQRLVADRIAELQEETERLSPLLEKSVALLTEHRQALITAAVTGQLEIPVAA
jgi:type I restriction enzyme S subunit